MKKLKIYRASAGSGKTFRLAVEYIALLVSNPMAYRHILAVTFTNKATAEMKSRIIRQLYGIAHKRPDAESYVSEIKSLTHISVDVIAKRCEIALTAILHDYSHFHIVTIDSFFQGIVRELANELGLPANINVELNSDTVLRQAVDEIIDNLSTSSPEYDSLVKYIQSRFDEEKSWKIDDSVIEFGKNLLNEHFLIHDSSKRTFISTKSNLDSYVGKVKAFKALRLEKLNCIIENECSIALQAIEATGKEKGFSAYALKLIAQDWAACKEWKDTYEKYICDRKNWVNKVLQGDDEVAAIISSTLIPCLINIKTALTERLKIQNDVSAALQHLYNLMIIGKISEQMDALNKQRNRFLLAETAHFLRDVINQDNLPFIYEKTGTTFHHIMIDEFQDTSALQWENFQPLLTECLDAGNSCLIVGDVKQSIYRFRNSDWQVLNNIDVPGEPMQPYVTQIVHNVNHRSAPMVVRFNNFFFTEAKQWLVSKYKDALGSRVAALSTAYSSVCQDICDPEKDHGYVCVRNATDEQPQLDQLQHAIEELLASGVKQSNIAILVRTSKHAVEICEHFKSIDSDISIISNEAYRLDASTAINMIIYALRSLSAISDRLHLATLAYHYQTLVLRNKDVIENISLPMLASDEELATCYLPAEFVQKRNELRFNSIAEIVEQVYTMLNLSQIERQDTYLLYFHDIVNKYSQDNLADIDSFLKAWDDELCEKTVPSGKADGIRIMTIHKSKGLEFHTVIVPYCNWNLNPKDTSLLWHTDDMNAEMPTLPLMPITFSKTKNSKIFRDDHDNETLLTLVDNINIIYVAFTRAVNNLIIITDDKKPGNSNDAVGANTLIKAIIDASEAEDNILYANGEIVPSKQDPDSELDSNNITVKFVSEPVLAEFLQSNESELFFATQKEDSTNANHLRLINIGNLYHNILQNINTIDDLHTAVMRLDSRGCFEQIADRDEIEAHLHSIIIDISDTHPEWFSPEWMPINERAILQGNQFAKRPDRVVVKGDTAIVIDYKTAQNAAAINADGSITVPRENEKQVRQYCELMHELGYQKVEGFLWYILDDIVYKLT